MRQTVEYCRNMGEGSPKIGIDHLPSEIARRLLTAGFRPAPGATREHRPRPDRKTLEDLLERYDGNVTEVARALERKSAQVYLWMKADGLDADSYRKKRDN